MTLRQLSLSTKVFSIHPRVDHTDNLVNDFLNCKTELNEIPHRVIHNFNRRCCSEFLGSTSWFYLVTCRSEEREVVGLISSAFYYRLCKGKEGVMVLKLLLRKRIFVSPPVAPEQTGYEASNLSQRIMWL